MRLIGLVLCSVLVRMLVRMFSCGIRLNCWNICLILECRVCSLLWVRFVMLWLVMWIEFVDIGVNLVRLCISVDLLEFEVLSRVIILLGKRLRLILFSMVVVLYVIFSLWMVMRGKVCCILVVGVCILFCFVGVVIGVGVMVIGGF